MPDVSALQRCHQKWKMLDEWLNWKVMLSDLSCRLWQHGTSSFCKQEGGKPSSSNHYTKKLSEFSRKPKKQAKRCDPLYLWAPAPWGSRWLAPSNDPLFDLPLGLWFCYVGRCATCQPNPAPLSSTALQRPFTQGGWWRVDLSGKELVI